MTHQHKELYNQESTLSLTCPPAKITTSFFSGLDTTNYMTASWLKGTQPYPLPTQRDLNCYYFEQTPGINAMGDGELWWIAVKSNDWIVLDVLDVLESLPSLKIAARFGLKELRMELLPFLRFCTASLCGMELRTSDLNRFKHWRLRRLHWIHWRSLTVPYGSLRSLITVPFSCCRTMSHHVAPCRTISFISATCWFKVMCCLFLQRSEDVWSTHQYVHRRAFGAALGLLGLKVSGSLYLSRLSCQFSNGTPIDCTWYSTGGWDLLYKIYSGDGITPCVALCVLIHGFTMIYPWLPSIISHSYWGMSYRVICFWMVKWSREIICLCAYRGWPWYLSAVWREYPTRYTRDNLC